MLPDHDMATNIVRWMKTKLHGYKPFVMSNDLSDSRLSDTERLLKPSAFVSQESFQPEPQHPLPPQENVRRPVNTAPKRHMNFQELECDVSVEGCNEDASGQRQEFSFTLYDLDGHGKITKDDIAGLVKTIYETLGQSIKVPHYGSKTIKVKLTVSPEKKPCQDETTEATKGPDVTPVNKWRKEVKKERRYREKVRRRHSISSSGLSEDREADVSEEEDDVPLNNKCFVNPAGITGSPTTIYSQYKKRSSSLQRQELLQIIQANMEKNNLCFQTTRKPPANVFVSPHRTRQPSPHIRNRWEPPRSHSHEAPPERRRRATAPTAHALKHRCREMDQARAKEQVVRWLEREFAPKYESPKYESPKYGKNTNIEREEKRRHHHVHEHVHHHYHHYRESSVV